MSQPAVSALAPLPFELVTSDGEPLETYWHVIQMNLFIDLIHEVMRERGRTDFFAGGDIFVYYAYEQARDVAAGRPYFRGPDVFYVGGVEGGLERKAWVAWEEGGRLPDLIVELLSPSTAKIDRTVKRDLYARVFRTSEYFLYEPATKRLDGLRLKGDLYQPLKPNAQGRLWSAELGLEIGLWSGRQRGQNGPWLRLYHPDGRLVPTAEERAMEARQLAGMERQRADAERQRADAAEAELKRLRALLAGS
jgi:Uma2 family endonuclease